MNAALSADFEKSYRHGPRIRFVWQQPVESFSVTVLFGPSGCGKSTVLRALAGLERPERGTIRCGEELWFDAERGLHRTPQQRDIGFAWQHYALFPQRTVRENIAYGLRRVPAAERDELVAEMLERFDVAGLAERFPRQISGGEQQRVALARALVRRPRLLLLDEPLAALDAESRRSARRHLRQVLSRNERPVILVTHDRVEAMSLADRIIVMAHGQILQTGSVDEVLGRPANPTVARIVGVETVLPGTMVAVHDGLAQVQVDSVVLTAVAPSEPCARVYVCIPMESISLQREIASPQSPRNQLPARVLGLIREGPLVRVELECGFRLTALITAAARDDLHVGVGDTLLACIKAPAIHLIPRS